MLTTWLEWKRTCWRNRDKKHFFSTSLSYKIEYVDLEQQSFTRTLRFALSSPIEYEYKQHYCCVLTICIYAPFSIGVFDYIYLFTILLLFWYSHRNDLNWSILLPICLCSLRNVNERIAKKYEYGIVVLFTSY